MFRVVILRHFMCAAKFKLATMGLNGRIARVYAVQHGNDET
jgi:hypothetical protein